jgi:hypothetical protein
MDSLWERGHDSFEGKKEVTDILIIEKRNTENGTFRKLFRKQWHGRKKNLE